jgi:hypothetical protein
LLCAFVRRFVRIDDRKHKSARVNRTADRRVSRRPRPADGWRETRRFAGLVALALTALQPSCTVDAASEEDDLTSITARERVLELEGYVYLPASASSSEILAAVKRETRSAFGALLAANVAVGTRELGNVDAKTFTKEKVDVVDASGAVKQALRVRYRYTDRAVLPKALATRSALTLGLLHGDYQDQATRVLKECTKNTAEDREMESDVWYVFNPSLASCKKAMSAEQTAIDAKRRDAGATAKQVVREELERLYIPMTARFSAPPARAKTSYPEYDRLWAGGIKPGVLTVTLMTGLIDHVKPGEKHYTADDAGYWETMDMMGELLAARPKLNVVATDPPTDLSTFKVAGKTLSNLSFTDFARWTVYDDGWPTGLTATEKKELARNVADRLKERWITFEEKVKVQIGSAAPKDTTVRVQLFFGAEEDEAPYRRAIKTSDVFLYNGHSYIGEGPLDPANFSKSDFPQSYQLFFIDSCISFNYYNADYWSFKTRGSADLDIISNGVESNSDGSGAAQAKFVVALLGGKQPSYLALLKSAETTGSDYAWGKDALRVVDGELDNQYTPAQKSIKIVSP